MAAGKYRNKKPLSGVGRFIAVPYRIIDSEAYRSLSHPAAKLLWDLSSQCFGDNNGRILANLPALGRFGWSSNDTLRRARDELIQKGFLHQTVQGHRPNKASWFALTWRPLSPLDGYDAGAEAGFEMWKFEKLANIKNNIRPPPDGSLDHRHTVVEGAFC